MNVLRCSIHKVAYNSDTVNQCPLCLYPPFITQEKRKTLKRKVESNILTPYLENKYSDHLRSTSSGR